MGYSYYKNFKGLRNLILLFSFLMILLFLIQIYPFQEKNTPNEFSPEHDLNLKNSDGWIINPIIIDNGDPSINWTIYNETYPWCNGAGTIDNPYTIKDVIINNSNSDYGIQILNSKGIYFIIENCSFYYPQLGVSYSGILLYNTDDGIIRNNTCSSYSNIGIEIHNCKRNMIYGNLIKNNSQYGVFINGANSKDNIVVNNVFIQNNIHGYDESQINFNYWYNDSLGNYWDDYSGKDTDDDNIGDIPYTNISGGANAIDNFPIWWDSPKFSINSPFNDSAFGLIAPELKLTIEEGRGSSIWCEFNSQNSSYQSLLGQIKEEVELNLDQNLWDKLSNGSVTIKCYVNDSKGWISYEYLKIRVYKPTKLPLNIWWNVSYKYRMPIFLTNMDKHTLPKGYSVKININTANLISSGKLREDGADLRILWYNSSNNAWLELDRINETNFNIINTEIWFKLQDSIIPSISTADYYIYYGNFEAINPPTNSSKIYEIYDDFSQIDGDAEGWTEINGSWSVINETYRENSYIVDRRTILDLFSIENASIEVKVKNDGGNFGAGVMFRLSNNTNFYTAGIGFWEYELAIGTWTNDIPTVLNYTTSSESALKNDTWYNLRIDLLGSIYKVFLDGVLKNYINDTDHLNIGQIGFMTWTSSAISYFDNLKIRLLLENEPVLFSGDEEILLPIFNSIQESSDPLELGDIEVITVNVTDLAGISQILIGFEGINHSMTYIGGDLWQYDSWSPNIVDIYNYSIYAENIYGHWNEVSDFIQVIDTTPPNFSDLYESSETVELGSSITISINASDLSGINQILIEIDGFNYSMNNLIGNKWQYDLWVPNTIGTKLYTIHIQDNYNNWNITSDSIKVTDTILPEIIINEPYNGQYFGATSPSFNVEVFDKSLDKMWYNLNLNPVKYFFDSNNSIDQLLWTSLLEGSNIIYFYANDSAGNENYNYVSVYKDSQDPLINIISPVEDDFCNNTNPNFIVRIIDENIDKMWYTLNSEISKHFFLENGTLEGWLSLLDGEITITFNANDTAGNLHSTFVKVYKDTNKPSIEVYSPITGQFFNDIPPAFSVRILDLNLDKMWYTLNDNVTKFFFEFNESINLNAWKFLLDGLINITFYANDSANNINSKIVQCNKDTLNPLGSIVINSDDLWTTSINVILTLTYNDDNSGIDSVRYSNDGISWSSWESASPTKAWTLTANNGLKTVFYEIRDKAGCISQFSDIIGLDTIDPSGSIEINGADAWTTSISVNLTLTYNDTTSGIDQVRYSNDGSSWSSWMSANTSKTWILSSSNGLKVVYYEIRDIAGRISQFSDSIGLDTIDPTGSIEINGGDAWTTSISVNLTLTSNDATSGVDQVRYSNDGISWSLWESANNTKIWILPTGDTPTKIVYFQVRDIAGRISQFSDVIGLDTVKPTGTIQINNGDIWTNSTSVTLALTYDDTTSGVNQVRYSNDGISWTAWESPNDFRVWNLASGDGSKTVYYEVKDKAGLVLQITDIIELDTTNPSGDIIINNGDMWTNSTNVILTLIYNDATSGIDQVRYSNDGITWSSWESTSPTKAWALTSGDGSKTVYYQIKDNVGLIFQDTDTIGLDTIGPTGSVIINNDDNWTISSSVILTLTYNDITSGVNQVRYSNDGILWSNWQAPSNTKLWTLTSGDGSKTVYYQIKDNAGLIFQDADTIGLDTVDPTGSIIINNDNDWTKSSSVTLSLVYNDTGSGISQVRYSNDGSSWSTWESPNSTKTWILSAGDNIAKVVYYEIRDNGGLIFQTSDTIGLDTVDPTGSIIINNDDSWTISTEVMLSLTYNDATSGVNQVRFSNDGNSWSSWESASSSKLWTLSVGDNLTKPVYYEISDNAGWIFQTIDLIGLDTVKPTGSITINNDDLWTTASSVSLSLTYSDTTSGIDQVRYSNDGITWGVWESATTSKIWTLSQGEGIKTVFYEIKDNVGLIFQTNDSIGLDLTEPTGSIEINNNEDWTNSTEVILSLSYQDIASGIDQVRYSNDSIFWSVWQDPNPSKIWILPSGDGSKTVYYQIRDNVGKISQYTDTIGLDTVEPSGSIIINSNDDWTISSSVILALTYNDITSGVDQVRYSNDGISWSSWEDASPTKTWTLSTGDDPSKNVHYEIKDNAGLIFQVIDTIGLDSVEPTGSIVINNNDDWTISSSVILTLTYNDITSSVDQVRYSNDGISWSSWEDASPTKTWTLSTGDGIKTVFYEIKDHADLIFQINDSIRIDTEVPIGSIIINDDNLWVNSTDVSLTLTYNDITSGVDQVRYSNDGISWSSWEAAIPTKTWTLSIGDGLKTVYYEIRDNVGLIFQTNDTIGLDTVDPTGSIIINNGDVWTNSTNVILTLTFNDLTSGVLEVHYSNDGISWSSWETYKNMDIIYWGWT
ncbi:MAG: right-handed parallel beta-helix repeat-containing protein [Candidatus Lokiarchaeota archaeon]